MRRLDVPVAVAVAFWCVGSAGAQPANRGAAKTAPQGVIRVVPSTAPGSPGTAGTTMEEKGRPQGSVPVPGSATADPKETVGAFVRLLQAGKAFEAVSEYFDCEEFMRLVFADDLGGLSEQQLAYMRQMSEVMFKAMLTIVPPDNALKSGKVAELKVETQSGGRASVSCVFDLPAPGKSSRTVYPLVLRNGRWRIGDFAPGAAALRQDYLKQHASGVGPVESMETFCAVALQKRVEADEARLHPRAADERRRQQDELLKKAHERVDAANEELRKAREAGKNGAK